MSELEAPYSPARLECLHHATWKHWLITEPFQVGVAKFTRLDVIEAQHCIRRDESALLRSEAIELRARWDALVLKICEASGYDVADGYDIAFSPYGERFAVVRWPAQRRRSPLSV